MKKAISSHTLAGNPAMSKRKPRFGGTARSRPWFGGFHDLSVTRGDLATRHQK
jgi:hypothetical protein